MDGTYLEETAKSFIDRCIDKFVWTDLSKDIVMEVGCGVEGFCGKAILDKFPNVGTIFGIDDNPAAVSNFRPKASTKMGCEFADIENSETLRKFKDKMTKVVSTHVFFMKEEEALRNMFDLLKPEGEAAVLWVVTALIDDWLKEVLKIHKWKDVYKGSHAEDLHEMGEAEYKEMAEEIGFRVIDCEKKEKVISYPTRRCWREVLYKDYEKHFDIPPELLEEFKEEGVQVLFKLSAKDAKGRLCYRLTELSLLLKKPA